MRSILRLALLPILWALSSAVSGGAGPADDGDRTAAEVVRRVYADVDSVLWPAAELSVQAQLDYLRDASAAGN